MSSITIDLPLETYKRLEAQARKIGQDPATLSRELLEAALQAREAGPMPNRTRSAAGGRTSAPFEYNPSRPDHPRRHLRRSPHDL